MARPIRARIDTLAFRFNYLLAQARAPHARAWAVVKANAYGHGIVPCAKAIADIADGFALLEASEAGALRRAGITQPIMLLEGAFRQDDVLMAAELNLTLTVHNAEQLRMLELMELPRPVDVFIKLNTGMNRLGLPPSCAAQVLARLRACPQVGQIGAMTHFSCADDVRGIEAAWSLFDSATRELGVPRSAANSATLLRFPHAHADWVRPGIMLYGGSPMPQLESCAALGLRPVMTLESELIGVQSIAAGQHVGYGASFVADRAMRVGVVACGYADGYPRHAGTGTPILVDGVRTRTLGRVSMDMLAVDLTELPAATVGTPVTLWGEGLPADEVASAAGTVSYELFCALAQRVPVLTS
ncbi:MAG: alanine racemase [Rhodocyclaceae bacterium]